MLRMIATEKQRYDDALGRTDFAEIRPGAVEGECAA